MSDFWATIGPVLVGGAIATTSGLLAAVINDRLSRRRTAIDERTKRGQAKAEELIGVLDELEQHYESPPVPPGGTFLQLRDESKTEQRRKEADRLARRLRQLSAYLPDSELRRRIDRLIEWSRLDMSLLRDIYVEIYTEMHTKSPAEVLILDFEAYRASVREDVERFLRSESLTKLQKQVAVFDQARDRVLERRRAAIKAAIKAADVERGAIVQQAMDAAVRMLLGDHSASDGPKPPKDQA
jgi:hypothetical protein